MDVKDFASMDFYQDHLNQVSRSFAFCIEQLEWPLRHWVSLTYLVCRMLDTIEDAEWSADEDQKIQFHEFDQLMSGTSALNNLKLWQQRFPKHIPKGEQKLIAESERVFLDFHSYPEDVRRTVQFVGVTMSSGMQKFAGRSGAGIVRLKNLCDVNRYCFFVAGLVGEGLTRLLSLVDSKVELTSKRLLASHHFGQFLQKVNLLKDQGDDEKVGRFLVPSRRELTDSLGKNALQAKEYLYSIPLEHQGYRLFCAWSLFLGLASLPWTNAAYVSGKKLKIPRFETAKILADVKSRIDKPEALNHLFEELFTKAGLKRREFAVNCSSVGPWPSDLYSGALQRSDLVDLGVCE
ncbi:MAG: squalene/phytoene synthase family protein [Pseudobdellovibrionaceae bacterium]|nr:squalene/phytoene synthase family protein [Bdellovibrionales bacterium]USN47979.1 MAG: squalene/phytoene synthase family protein [Pseudobdellovibrionaceae bacterium]